MPSSVSIERWQTEPYRKDDRCDLCGRLARVVRVTLEPSQSVADSESLRLCPGCLRSRTTHTDLLEKVKVRYPRLWERCGDQVCEVCGAPAEEVVEYAEAEADTTTGTTSVRSLGSRVFCKRCATGR